MLPSEYQPSTYGELTRYSHAECGDRTDRLYVKRVAGGFLYHCHNCAPKFSGFYASKDPCLSPRQTEKALLPPPPKHYGLEDNGTLIMPNHFTTDMPMVARKWYMKYGISEDEAAISEFMWDPHSERLILPVFDEEGRLIQYQSRAVYDNQQPKYVTTCVANRRPHFEIKNNETVVVVEDVLSAIKVGRVCSTLCLHGSFIEPDLAKKLREYKDVIIWLDADKYDVACKAARQLASKGIKVSVAYTSEDPKEYSLIRIRQVIFDARKIGE